MSSCLFYIQAEYIMQNAGLDESSAWVKIARRNISIFRYEDDATLMEETEEEWKRFLMMGKEES